MCYPQNIIFSVLAKSIDEIYIASQKFKIRERNSECFCNFCYYLRGIIFFNKGGHCFLIILLMYNDYILFAIVQSKVLYHKQLKHAAVQHRQIADKLNYPSDKKLQLKQQVHQHLFQELEVLFCYELLLQECRNAW